MLTESQQDNALLVLKRDDKDIALVTSLLEKVGFHVSHSSNTNDALEFFGSANVAPSLLVIDEAVNSAGLPGFLQCAVSLNPGVRTVLLSEREDFDPNTAWGGSVKMHAFLKRPFRRAQFLGSVLHLMDEHLVRTA